MKIDFEHKMAAHCENGATVNLLNFYGKDLSEPMVFGMGSGLFFIHFTFIKMHGLPVTAFRPMPGLIFKRVNKALGVKVTTKKFKGKPEKSMEALDDLLAKGIPVGLVVGVYHLTYFPEPYRFHFNGHNIIIIGKEGNDYIVSDPTMETIVTISREDLMRVRYAKGTYEPNGKMYYINHAPKVYPDLKKSVIKSLKKTCRDMLDIPGYIAGAKGIQFLSKKIRKYPTKLTKRKASLYLGQIVRMQEEIGTGGAGFRFLFSAYLQEAGDLLNHPELRQYAQEMTVIGDKWRQFASQAARVCKGRPKEGESYDSVADLLLELGKDEQVFFKKLKKEIKTW